MWPFGRSTGYRLVIRNSADDLVAKLRRLRKVWQAPGKALTAIGRVLWEDTERFQFAPGGTPAFRPLHPQYEKRKMKLYGPQPILTASGAMRRGLRYDVIAQQLTVGVWSPITVGKAAYNLLWLHARGKGRLPIRDVGQKILKATVDRVMFIIKWFTEGKAV